MTAAERRTLLALLGFLTFAAVYVQVAMVPVLSAIASEFSVTTGTAGLAVAAYGVPGIILGLVAGPFSDRFGRKVFLVGGSLMLSVLTVVAAFAPSFALFIVCRALAGAGASLIFPNMNAVIGDSFPYRERGRASAIVIALNTMGSIVGIPMSGLIAEAFSWRLSLGVTGVLAFAVTLVFARLLPSDRPLGVIAHPRALYARLLASRSALATIGASFLGALYWATWSTYLVVFLETRYGLAVGLASTIALASGCGILLGSLVGGRLGDHGGHRVVAYRSIFSSGVAIFLLTVLPLSLPLAVVGLFLGSTIIGMRFASNTALLSEQLPAARGTMLAVASSLQSAALVVGASVGGMFVDGAGFEAVGLFCVAVAAGAAFITRTFVREDEPSHERLEPAGVAR